jgi:hypothetical protein
MSADRSIAQWFCLIGGGLLILRGTVGVAMDPDFGAPGEGWHQLFHLFSGVLLVAVAVAGRPRSALVATFTFAFVYGAITLGGIAGMNDVAGIIPVEASDNLIHAFFTLGSLAFGIATLARDGREPAATAI